MIPPAFIDDLLARTDIVDVIEPHVVLKKAGRITQDCVRFTKKSPPAFRSAKTSNFITASDARPLDPHSSS